MMTEKEKKIKHFMEALGISRKEAEKLYLDDMEDNIGAEGEALDKKASTMGGHREKGERKKQAAKKEKKPDEEKLAIISKVIETIKSFPNVVIKGREKDGEVSFSMSNNDYTLKLIRHRKKEG